MTARSQWCVSKKTEVLEKCSTAFSIRDSAALQSEISARSMGALNVQVILEPLGGGGHLTMAGAQLRDCTVKEAEARIRAQIDEYRANQECQEELVGAV